MPLGGRRIGRPGLIGTAARTAVISGTATAVSGRVAARQQRRAHEEAEQEQYQLAQQEMQAPPPPPPAPPAPAPAAAGGDLVGELQKLAALKEQGLLSDEEFAAAKAQLLG